MPATVLVLPLVLPATLKELISQTMIRWAQEDQIQDAELVRMMFTLLQRQYDSIGELLQALRTQRLPLKGTDPTLFPSESLTEQDRSSHQEPLPSRSDSTSAYEVSEGVSPLSLQSFPLLLIFSQKR